MQFLILFVKLFGVKSKIYLATFGVPQGGYFSPLLFSLLVVYFSQRHIICYADDIKRYICISSLDDRILLHSDFDRFTEWFNLLGLFLNVSKYKSEIPDFYQD